MRIFLEIYIGMINSSNVYKSKNLGIKSLLIGEWINCIL